MSSFKGYEPGPPSPCYWLVARGAPLGKKFPKTICTIMLILPKNVKILVKIRFKIILFWWFIP